MASEAISPIDGRYKSKVKGLENYFSDYALTKERVKVVVAWFKYLVVFSENKPDYPFYKLMDIYQHFNKKDYNEIKKLEALTNHDIKAVVDWVVSRLPKEVESFSYLVHYGCTSEDVNSLAYASLEHRFYNNQWMPLVIKLIKKLDSIINEEKDRLMLARTHGQPATVTTLGREIAVFNYRLLKIIPKLFGTSDKSWNAGHFFDVKWGGAVGNYSAHCLSGYQPKVIDIFAPAAEPKEPEFNISIENVDAGWIKFVKQFIQFNFNSEFSDCPHQDYPFRLIEISTQISDYDGDAERYFNSVRFNNVLIDLSRDMWDYISRDYFKKESKEKEVGSSTMSQKSNPIEFENAESNLGLSNNLFIHLADNLTKSRLQRDLTGSSLRRNVGVAYAHQYISLLSILDGLERFKPTQEITYDLKRNYLIYAEAYQTILRPYLGPDAYEMIKSLSRKATSNENYVDYVIDLICRNVQDSDTCMELSKKIVSLKLEHLKGLSTTQVKQVSADNSVWLARNGVYPLKPKDK